MKKIDNHIKLLLGQNVRNIRIKLNLTQEEFAEKLDIHSQFLSRIENGKNALSISNIINICQLANCSVKELFKGITEAPDINEQYENLNPREQTLVKNIISYLSSTN